MKYLLNVVETYRLEDENQVEEFLKELKADDRFIVTRYSSTKKERKSKGEVIDEYIKFSVTKTFNSEKEPEDEITVDYNVGE